MTEISMFRDRHIGPSARDVETLLGVVGYPSMEALIDAVVPSRIRRHDAMPIPAALSEEEALEKIAGYAARNKVVTSMIGMGYYGTHTPNVILRNVLENPAWYTAYTPYQPEISQGRLEALLNFQTMVADLTGMDVANASMLDEATAVAEAVVMAHRFSGGGNTVMVDPDTHPQTVAVLKTRLEPLGISIAEGTAGDILPEGLSAVVVQYPGSSGAIRDISAEIDAIHEAGSLVVVATDLLALTLLTPPGEMGADIVVGSTQRFGVPMGFGGPHAAFLATREKFQRRMPGRLVGVSVDTQGRPAYRLALQTREQHIRREKATSNICTAQVLLAVMAGLYAVWHGADGLKAIAGRVHDLTSRLAAGLTASGHRLRHQAFFDTLMVETGAKTDAVMAEALAAGFNLRKTNGAVGISLDETTSLDDCERLLAVFGAEMPAAAAMALPSALRRRSQILAHPVFSRYRSETEMLRYLRRMADKDLALDRTMIPLGSCTMKLNATAEMIPITWPGFGQLHPFAPEDQAEGYRDLVRELENWLCAATGYDAMSLQPNAGSQGEFAGLMAIRAWHRSRDEGHRNVCLIPASAHGTNPASAAMAGMKVVVVDCDGDGNVDLEDLNARADEHADNLAALMVTYPSTHGVFEEAIRDICQIIHDRGGQVYVDGANLNALVGLASLPGFGADVSHLNLHKTFCIPHGGGGPGVGPIGVAKHLAPFLPGHPLTGESAVSAAPEGSASILPISWMYIAMMGAEGLKEASSVAILSANYIAARLKEYYPVLYTGKNGLVAHECIIDIRSIKDETGISNEDIAKRLMDYGFHAPTMSFPVAGTLMIEPTESESLHELDRFCDAMIAIHGEIDQVRKGVWPKDNNPLVHAPHTAEAVTDAAWDRPYSRQLGAFPAGMADKYWPPVSRIDNVWGDRNLHCSCPSVDEWKDVAE
ncbi:aminomethyl-transferring glycine dehydrogenase [Alphaproteobacteria bacterium LSUCC0684]